MKVQQMIKGNLLFRGPSLKFRLFFFPLWLLLIGYYKLSFPEQPLRIMSMSVIVEAVKKTLVGSSVVVAGEVGMRSISETTTPCI